MLAVRDFGDLSARVVGDEGPIVVLLHGFGASGSDLVALSQVLGPNRRYIFPEARLTLPPAYGDGRAWWMLDMEKMQRAMMMGTPRDLAEEYPEGLAKARSQLDSHLKAIEAEFAVKRSEIVLGGFSQGAMLSCDVAIHSEEKPKSLVLLSGALLARDEWVPQMDGAPLNVFQSHGTHDTVLAQSGGIALKEALEASGSTLEWHSFRGGHEIPMPVLDALRSFLSGLD